MRNIANIKPSAVLASLIQSAKLTNAVSRKALRDANVKWTAHIAKPRCNRDQQTLIDVADQLRLVIVQVSQRRCRINPPQWPVMIQLEADLRAAYVANINLEPLLDAVAANTDHSEVA
ncbi:hypothetical protein SAMN05660405_02663 [Psychrobacter pacificensis]|uniref:Uncharacterized protein n=1 Tax=Psychrobacter pacificensis TaxID=112002 RepID=A0A1G7AZP0_9GAMM|nr:hypothetical protein [Psychrobacter pacificensis]GLR28987.1 hypothetical protein GCM10007915_12250 [Psychrobacter pacificensis]SDE20358.1 hypothetical protein SAMN05660405_02663 [Psychrobacter pacificensis]